MNLMLYRYAKRENYTIGRLYFDKDKCDTLEPPVRELKDIDGDGRFDSPGEGKIYGNTAILPGRYKILMEYSPKFNRMMPYLQEVKGFTGIMLHPGNSVDDTAACVLVGENTVRGRLVNSRAWSDLINKKITEALKRGEEVHIDIL